ncbi:MAG: helix-turn-helix domain-containing protein [Pseudomonadales bacterium]
MFDYFAHEAIVLSVVATGSRAVTHVSNNRMTIGKVAAQTGCNIETIRFYEKECLLPKPERTDGGHRLYTEVQIDRLIFIRRSRELGFSMSEVRQLLSLVDGEEVSCESVKAIAEIHLRDIRTKIADLKKMEHSLKDLSDQCSGVDAPECPIIDGLMPHQMDR